MPLIRPRYLVETDPELDPIEVAITSGDQLRAEMATHALKLPEKLPFHTSVLWIWAALVRLGLEERKAGAFIQDPPEWAPLKGDDGEPVLEPVDPTGEAATASG